MRKALVICFVVLLGLCIVGLISCTIYGVFNIVVVGKNPNIFQIVFAFFIAFFTMLIGVAIIGYEGRGTEMNIAFNWLFYLFLVAIVVSSTVLLVLLHHITGKGGRNEEKVFH